MADINRRYTIIFSYDEDLFNWGWDRMAAVPLFPALRRFPEGRRFKQWTGDDSKALMKVS